MSIRFLGIFLNTKTFIIWSQFGFLEQKCLRRRRVKSWWDFKLWAKHKEGVFSQNQKLLNLDVIRFFWAKVFEWGVTTGNTFIWGHTARPFEVSSEKSKRCTVPVRKLYGLYCFQTFCDKKIEGRQIWKFLTTFKIECNAKGWTEAVFERAYELYVLQTCWGKTEQCVDFGCR